MIDNHDRDLLLDEMRSLVNDLREEVYGEPMRQITGMKDRVAKLEKRLDRMEHLDERRQWLLRGILVGLAVNLGALAVGVNRILVMLVAHAGAIP